MEQTTKITAHSGAEHTADNSLDFVRYALGLAVDALEVDVRRRADGVLALGHDAADEQSPTLEEVFALVTAHPSMCINCDLKMPGLEQEVAALAQQAGLAVYHADGSLVAGRGTGAAAVAGGFVDFNDSADHSSVSSLYAPAGRFLKQLMDSVYPVDVLLYV